MPEYDSLKETYSGLGRDQLTEVVIGKLTEISAMDSPDVKRLAMDFLIKALAVDGKTTWKEAKLLDKGSSILGWNLKNIDLEAFVMNYDIDEDDMMSRYRELDDDAKEILFSMTLAALFIDKLNEKEEDWIKSYLQ